MKSQFQGAQTLESSQTVKELKANYDLALSDVLTPRDSALSNLGSWVSEFENSGLTLVDFTRQHSERVYETLFETSQEIGRIISSVPEILDGIEDFLPVDRLEYHKARRTYSSHPSTTLRMLDRTSSSRRATQAMRAGLDDLVLMTARRTFRSYPISTINNLERDASGRRATQAMRAGLDDLVLMTARRTFRSYPISTINNLERDASGRRATQAMRAGLDDLVLMTARRNYPKFPTRTIYDLERDASGRRAATKIKEHLVTPYDDPSAEDSKSQNPYEESRTSYSQTQESTRTSPAYDDLLSSLRRLGDRSILTTIESFDPSEVSKVVATVKYLRDKHPEITDKEIALKYTRLSNNAENTSPERMRATQIVLTLMGNKISGTLPF